MGLFTAWNRRKQSSSDKLNHLQIDRIKYHGVSSRCRRPIHARTWNEGNGGDSRGQEDGLAPWSVLCRLSLFG
eukprot:scaffold137_cov398-Prasinococcus_capsulatus_cf.AAC.51